MVGKAGTYLDSENRKGEMKDKLETKETLKIQHFSLTFVPCPHQALPRSWTLSCLYMLLCFIFLLNLNSNDSNTLWSCVRKGKPR